MNSCNNDIKDRRAGYQRQVDEPETIHCECGARVVKRFGELHHIGDCPVIDSKNTEEK